MADRYWVGGTGTWNISSTTNWSASSGGASGASVPTASDNVIFDQAATYTVTLTGALTCLDITVSAGTVTFTSNGTLAVSGGMSLVAATVWNATGTITFNSTTGTVNLISTSATFSCSITFNGAGGSWRLLGALTITSSRNLTFTAGSLDINGNTVTAGTFTSIGTTFRSITWSGGNISVNGTNQTVVNVTFTLATDFVINGTSNIRLIGSPSTGTRQITGPQSSLGVENSALNVYITGGTDIFTFGTNRVWKNIDFTGFKGSITSTTTSFICYGNFTLDSGMTSVAVGTGNWRFAASGAEKTINMGGLTTDVPISFINGTIQPFYNGTWSMASALLLPNSALTITSTSLPDNLNTQTLKLKAGTTNTVGSFVTTGQGQKYLQSTVAGTQATISDASGTNTVTYLTIQDSAATGGATWNAYDPTNVNAGNNTGWFLPPTPAVGNEITMRLRSFTQPRRF